MLTQPHTRSRTQDAEVEAEENRKKDAFFLAFAILYTFKIFEV